VQRHWFSSTGPIYFPARIDHGEGEIDGKASRQALQVLVGYGGVPDPDEFMSADQAMRARWRKALRVIINSASILTELVDEGEEQSEIEYQYDEEDTKKEKAVR